jgi:hypothetical protein
VELSASEVLAVWERGLRQSLGDRALSLLGLSEDVLQSPELLSAGTRDAALLRIRRRLFGDRIEAVVGCASCGEQLEVTLSVSKLLPDETLVTPASTFVELDGSRVELRVPTAGDLAALRDVRDLEEGILRLLRRCVFRAERDGRAIPIDEFSPQVYEALDEALAAADPSGDTTVSLVCPSCGAANNPIFDPPSFLWRETQQLARDTLLDVHEIAQAYGWAEADILALSRARRRFYLEAIET